MEFSRSRRTFKQVGALYLTIAICGGFSIGYVPWAVITQGDPAASLTAITQQVVLFRLGVLADSAVILCEIAITALLYQIFRPVHETAALIAALARSGMIIVMGVNLLLWVMPYALSTGSYAIRPETLHALTETFLTAHALGVFIWQIFFGAHLLALGWLILHSNFVPRLLGWGLSVGAFGYLIQAFARLTFVDLPLIEASTIALLSIVTVSELTFGIWCLMRGSRRVSSHRANL